MAVTDVEIARAQWLEQVKVIRRNQRRLERVIGAAYRAGLARWQSSGAVVIPIDAQRDLTAAFVRMWMEAGQIGGRFPVDQEKGAFPALENKQEELTLFERIILAFIQRFGAAKVQQITETTRDQLVRTIDKGVTQGLGQEGIAKMITDRIPALSRTRARVIARTEVHTAAMYASEEVAKTSPLPMNKRWISVFDARTRDFGEGDGEADQFNHRIMNEVTVGPDELFAVPRSPRYGGGFEMLTGPGDPNGSAGNVINCRCALIYRRVGRPWPKTEQD